MEDGKADKINPPYHPFPTYPASSFRNGVLAYLYSLISDPNANFRAGYFHQKSPKVII